MTLTLKISVALATEQRIRLSESKNAFISGVIEDAVKVHDPTRYNYLHQVWQQQTPSIFLDELRDVVAKVRSLTTNGKYAEALEMLGTVGIEHPQVKPSLTKWVT